MFWIALIVILFAVVLVKLGALSVWAGVLAITSKFLAVLVFCLIGGLVGYRLLKRK